MKDIYILNGWPAMDCPITDKVATSKEGLQGIIEEWLEELGFNLIKDSIIFSKDMDKVTFNYSEPWDLDTENPYTYQWDIGKPVIY